MAWSSIVDGSPHSLIGSAENPSRIWHLGDRRKRGNESSPSPTRSNAAIGGGLIHDGPAIAGYYEWRVCIRGIQKCLPQPLDERDMGRYN